MINEIPSIKANPEWIIPLMKIINECGSNTECRDKKTNEYLEKVGRGRKKNIIASTRGVSYTSLNTLELTIGRGKSKKLSDKGLKFLNVYDTESEIEFLKVFARHVYELDKTWCDMIGTLKEICELKKQVYSDDVIEAMVLKGIKSEGMDIFDRFKRWSRYLEYVKIISKKAPLGRGKLERLEISLNEFQLNLIENCENDVSIDKFISVLKEEYKKQFSLIGSRYVPIPSIRKAVCSSANIWWWDFDTFFKKIPKTTDEYNIVLSPPMKIEPEGIDINNKYYYYISIY